MDSKERYELGLKIRKEVLGEAHVQRSMANADDFSKPFQEIVTEYGWGGSWGRGVLAKRERSILNLGMLGAMGRHNEFKVHVKGALNNGVTPEELREVLIQIAVYCGLPAGLEVFRLAREVMDEMGVKTGGDD